MIHSVSLESLALGIEFPANLKDRISYDEVKKCLTFDGFMSKADFDALLQLGKDFHYQRAIEKLFQIATAEEEPSPRNRIRAVVVVVGLILVAVALLFGVILRLR